MIKVFNLNGTVINVDNDIDANALKEQGAKEIDASIFGKHAHWASSENTFYVGGKWTFNPDMDEIEKINEEAEEAELDEVLVEAVGTNPHDKIAKLKSMSFSYDSAAQRYLDKLEKQVGEVDSKFVKFL